MSGREDRNSPFRGAAEEVIAFSAKDGVLRDGLTGLPCRDSFIEKCEEIFRFSDNSNQAALHVIHQKNLKEIVMTHGLHIGEGVLKVVARRLYGIFNADKVFARLEGDNFGLLQREISHNGYALYTARRVFENLGAPLDVAGHSINIIVNIGISLFPDHGRDWNTLSHKAVQAMQEAGQKPGNNYLIYKGK